jgi:hypothetical protein
MTRRRRKGLPPSALEGLVSADGHPLDGLWVKLTARHVGDDSHYNLTCFPTYPGKKETGWVIAGYAQAVLDPD